MKSKSTADQRKVAAANAAAPSINAVSLLANATPLDDARLLVFEPVVKQYLRERKLIVPRGVTGSDAAALIAAAAGLRAPFVVKAFGPGIVHKTELGAVKLGVSAENLQRVIADITTNLARAGVHQSGFLLEEQLHPGLELIVGVVIRAGIPVIMCGLGGTLTEFVDKVAVGLLPLSDSEAQQMAARFSGAARGMDPAAFVTAVRDLLLAIAGDEGVALQLLEIGMVEFECNPVIVSSEGAAIADARLILAKTPGMRREPAVARDLRPLFHPRSIAIAGVSGSGKGLGNLSLESYRRAGWNDHLYVIHPSAERFGNVPAVRSLAQVPGGGVDYLQVVLPAAGAVELVATEGHLAQVVQVLSDGFTKSAPSGRSLAEELLMAARGASVPLIGPNCIGTYCPAGRQTYQLAMPTTSGTIGIVSQSGGMSTDLIEVGFHRGLRFSKVCSVGNAIDVSPAEVLEYLLDDGETTAVGIYLEGLSDTERLVRALRRARGKTPVVLLVAGQSASGAHAARSHTGALASDARLLEALAASTGVTIVPTMDALLGVLLGFQETGRKAAPICPPSVLVAGHGGGHTVVAGDLCEMSGLALPQLEPAVVAALTSLPLGVQKSLVNPIELPIGPIRPPESMRAVLDTVLQHQAFSDLLLHFSARSFYKEDYFEHGAGQIEPLLERLRSLAKPLPGNTRVFAVARSIEVIPVADRERLIEAARSVGVPLYAGLEDAVRAIAAVQTFDRYTSRSD